MKRLTAYVSGHVQRTGYRARVVDLARALGLRGTVENLDDGRVKITAEGDDDKLRWFEDAIDIKNALISVSSIETVYSSTMGDFSNFYKVVGPDETDSRLDTAAIQLKDLIGAVNNMNNNLGGKMDVMIQKQDRMLEKQDQMLEKQDQMLDTQKEMVKLQHHLLDEVKDSRRDLKTYLDRRFEKLEGEVGEMRFALKAKGII
ncbi:MAG TPA: acylphosphatase [Methanotrichaceae archaeon]|nr:acylphosphatase [Methanotrichaceae archaeon]HQF17687.1 acylphosphatase [Methanotrichaceae archaeon]HQI92290.1 acylphosphatase [Methanotrichaceae archaeon]HQJ29381.1 acylphosphatase [Methanotrichaceae archaeon]